MEASFSLQIQKNTHAFTLPLPCAVTTFGNPESHLEGRGGLLMPPSHLSRRPTSHSTPRALQPSSERGSQAGAAAGLLHSGAHSRSAHLRRCTGTCSSAGRSLHFGKWLHRTHSCLLLPLEYAGSRAEKEGERENQKHNTLEKLYEICKPHIVIFRVEAI